MKDSKWLVPKVSFIQTGLFCFAHLDFADCILQLSVEPDSPHVFLSCGEDGTVLQIDLREEDTRNKWVWLWDHVIVM